MINKIPKSFKLFATTWKVHWNDKKLNDRRAYGVCESFASRITLSTEQEGDKLSVDKMIDTFYHEKVHAILDTMYEYELSDNEKFVDTFAKLLRQSEETAKYSKNKSI